MSRANPWSGSCEVPVPAAASRRDPTDRFALGRVALCPAEQHSRGVLVHDPSDLAPRQLHFLARAHSLAAQGLERIPGKLSSVDLVYGQ